MLCDDREGQGGGGEQGRLKREEVSVYIRLVHFVLQQKLT